MKIKNVLSKRGISTVIILLIFGVATLLSVYLENNIQRRVHHHKEKAIQYMPNNIINEDNTVANTFSTHLPLVIVDTNGEEPKADSVWDEEKGYRVPVEDDPYVNGAISIIDNEKGINSIDDDPTVKSNIKIRLRGNSSLEFDKKQYFVKLINSDGSKNKQDILGMGENWEWIINISSIDKSLLRNYMSINIAGEIMPNTPDMRFCEFIMKDGDSYHYKGVYLVMENIKQGSSRVNISEYDPKFTTSSYVLRRDRFDETGTMINNYGTKLGLTESFLEIKYPPKNDITSKTIKYIEEDINKFEKALFSDDPKEYFKYRDYINEDSFIDYFIINEFFANYDAGFNSTYMYKENESKLSMGPVWDFDHSIDHFDHTKLKIDTTAMHNTPWYRELLKDTKFVDKMISRYKSLRKGILSEENIISYIDEVISFLGPAQDRDWDRWEKTYKSKYLFDTYDDNGNIINRNTQSYEEEIDKIKTVLTDHGKWLDENIDSLYQFSEFDEKNTQRSTFERISDSIFGKTKEISISSIAAIIFIGIFIVAIILVQKD